MPHAGALACGLAVWASFAPGHLWPAAFAGIFGFLRLLRGRTVPKSFGFGFLFGIGWFTPLLWWSWTASGTPVAWAALVASQALFAAVLGALWQGLVRVGESSGPWLRAAGLAATFAAMEQLRATWPLGGLPWGLVGFGQTNSPLIHLAPLGSTQLVAFALAGSAALAESAAFSRDLRRSTRLAAGSLAILGVFLPWFFPLPWAGEGSVRVAFAQGHVARPGEQVSGSRSLAVTEGLRAEAAKLEPGTFDLLVLPESASDRDFRVDAQAAQAVGALAAQAGVPVLLGTQSYLPDATRTNDYVALVGGTVAQSYSKQHPVPFGEYVPARDVFHSLSAAVDNVAIDMVPGVGPAVLDVPLGVGEGGETLKVAVPICFEIGDARVVDAAMHEGAGLLVVPTNNASFADTSESAQQFDITRFRAVQTGRTAIQVSTVGVSGAVDPNGVVTRTTGRWSAEHHVVDAGISTRLTPATRLSAQIEALVWAVGGVFAALALWQVAASPRPHRKGHS